MVSWGKMKFGIEFKVVSRGLRWLWRSVIVS